MSIHATVTVISQILSSKVDESPFCKYCTLSEVDAPDMAAPATLSKATKNSEMDGLSPFRMIPCPTRMQAEKSFELQIV